MLQYDYNLFDRVFDAYIKLAKLKRWETEEKYLHILKEASAEIWENLMTTSDQFKVICHGDFWTSNLLYK